MHHHRSIMHSSKMQCTCHIDPSRWNRSCNSLLVPIVTWIRVKWLLKQYIFFRAGLFLSIEKWFDHWIVVVCYCVETLIFPAFAPVNLIRKEKRCCCSREGKSFNYKLWGHIHLKNNNNDVHRYIIYNKYCNILYKINIVQFDFMLTLM